MYYLKSPENLKLTRKEEEILVRIAQGEHNGDIAKSMNVTIHTIKARIQGIFLKLNVKDRTQAVVKAIKYKLIEFE